jgi:hypothetical protein
MKDQETVGFTDAVHDRRKRKLTVPVDMRRYEIGYAKGLKIVAARLNRCYSGNKK